MRKRTDETLLPGKRESPLKRKCMEIMLSMIIAAAALISWSAGVYGQEMTTSDLKKSAPVSYEPEEETISDVELSETQDAKTLGLSFSPRFEDAISRDVIRLRTRVQYGFTDNFETRAELMSYTGSFFRNKWDTGFAYGLIGVKYKFQKWPGFANIRSSTGVNVRFPLGTPPEELNGRYSNVSPYITFSRFLDRYPNVQTFFSTQLNVVTDTPFRAKTSEERPDNSLRLTAGGIYYYSEKLRYSLDVSYRTTAIDNGNENDVLVTTGIYWNIPKSYTSLSPGRWQVAVGIEVPVTDEDENFSLFFKMKWNFDLLRYSRKFIS